MVPGYLSPKRLEGLVEPANAETEDIESVGGLVVHLEDGGVAPGISVNWDGIGLIVERVENGRPTRVRVRRLPKRKK
mgnify:CR=1 FL=1